MELSRINIENRERIKKVLGLNDSSLVKMHENDLLNELLDTIVFFDDDEKNKFIPRIQDLSDELTQLKQKVTGLEQKLVEANKTSQLKASDKPKDKEKEKEKETAVSTNNTLDDTQEDAHEVFEKNKKQIANFLKKKLSVIDNGDLESIHPKHKELEEEVLRLAKENGELNSIIIDDMDLIDSLMIELKNHKIEWKHSMIDKRAQKVKSFNAGYQPFGRLFIYKKLLSIPKLELEKEKAPSN